MRLWASQCCAAELVERMLLASASSIYNMGKPSSCMGLRDLFCMPKLFMSTPRIIPKKDQDLEAVMEADKKLKPVLQIKDMVMKAGPDGLFLKREKKKKKKKKDFSLRVPPITPSSFVKRYPNIFEIYFHPKERKPFCRLTQQAMALVEEEKRIHKEQEVLAVQKLRKLLMMMPKRRTMLTKLESARRDLGFSPAFLQETVPNYPEFFRFVLDDNQNKALELVAWDDALAVSEVERKAKEDARNKGLGDIETRGQPLAFKVSYSKGMFLRRRILELLEEWQRLPYISPYHNVRARLKHGTSVLEKRNVAVLHELLWLTLEKKGLLKFISTFRTDLRLPNKPFNLIKRYPGIFYVSYRGATETCILREGYCKSKLVEDNPFAQIKAKYAEMIKEGPCLRAMMKQKGRERNYLASEQNLLVDGHTEHDSPSENDSDDDEDITFSDAESETEGDDRHEA